MLGVPDVIGNVLVIPDVIWNVLVIPNILGNILNNLNRLICRAVGDRDAEAVIV